MRAWRFGEVGGSVLFVAVAAAAAAVGVAVGFAFGLPCLVLPAFDAVNGSDG